MIHDIKQRGLVLHTYYLRSREPEKFVRSKISADPKILFRANFKLSPDGLQEPPNCVYYVSLHNMAAAFVFIPQFCFAIAASSCNSTYQ